MSSSGKRTRSNDDEAAVVRPKKTSTDAKKQRHKAHMKQFKAWSKTSSTSATEWLTQDEAILREKHQFLRNDDVDAVDGEKDWKVRMAVRYYQKLSKEYALADFSRYKEGKVGLRWRTEREVVDGKGQFVCGNKACDASRGLESYEVLFAYVEQREKKQCLVKLRVCPPCALKLFHRKIVEIQARHRQDKAAAEQDVQNLLQGKQIDDDESDADDAEQGD